jgi:hypothetical protein
VRCHLHRSKREILTQTHDQHGNEFLGFGGVCEVPSAGTITYRRRTIVRRDLHLGIATAWHVYLRRAIWAKAKQFNRARGLNAYREGFRSRSVLYNNAIAV